MRVTTSLIYELGIESITRQQALLLKTQQHIASQKRVMTPSDDPIAAAQAVTVSQAMARTSQYSANIGAAGDALAHVDSVLGQVTDVLHAARTQAIAGGGVGLSDADRRSLATDVRAQLAQLVGLANAKDGDGGYMFAGYATDVRPFADSPAGVSYAGDSGLRALEVSPGRKLPISISGDRAFMRVPQGNGTFVATPATANTGNGIVTPGGVVDTGALTGDTYRIDVNVVGGVTTYDVVNVTASTVVSTGNAYVDGGAITVGGMQITLAGTLADGDEFTLAPAGKQSLFTALNDLVTALEAPVTTPADRSTLSNRLTRVLADLDQGLEHMLTLRAETGASLRELEMLAAGNAGQQLLNEETLSRLQDLDYAKALSDFTRQQLALEAAQKSFLQVTGLSLFDYL